MLILFTVKVTVNVVYGKTDICVVGICGSAYTIIGEELQNKGN